MIRSSTLKRLDFTCRSCIEVLIWNNKNKTIHFQAAGIKGNVNITQALKKKKKTKNNKKNSTDFIFGPPNQILRAIVLEDQKREIKCRRIVLFQSLRQ